jgi:polysaccharide biosynthesis transport protein
MTTRLTAPATPSSEAPQGSGRSINPLASLLRRWKLALVILFAVTMLGLPVAWWKGKPAYRAEGALYVSPRFLRNLQGDQEHELQSNSQYREFVQQQVRTVNRFDILDAALAPGSAPAKVWRKGPESQRRAVDRLRGALQISPVPDTYQVTVALEGSKPDGLAEIVNAVMDSYLRASHRELLYDSDARLANLAAEKTQLEQSINQSIEARTAIASELGTTVFSGAIVNSFDRQLGATAEALQDARRQRFVAEAAAGAKEANPAPGTLANALQNALSDNSLNTFKGALSSRKADLLISIGGLSPQHPNRIAAENEIQAIEREMEAVTAALRDRLARNLDVINRAKLEQSSTVERMLNREAQKIREQTESYSRAYQNSLELGAELDRARKRLHDVEDRISFLQLEARAPGFIRVFSKAMTPDLPISGGRKKLALLVLAAAFGIASVVPIGLDYIDPRLRAPKELEMHLRLPITGSLPESKTIEGASMLRIAVSIRRHLDRLRHPVVVVTAIAHGGGSSTVSLGLGTALNRLGVRTLVVEANPQTPDARYAGHAHGLIDHVNGGAELPILAATATLPDRVATGAGSAEDLLPVERLMPLFAQQNGAWDLIVIDASPIESSLVTEELIRVFGAALLVVDSQRDKKNAVTRCLEKMDLLAPEAFGAVLNKVARDTPRFLRRNHEDTPAVLVA